MRIRDFNTGCSNGNRDQAPFCLCKVGGSLLNWDQLPARLQQFLDQLNQPAVLLVGGGKVADLVRKWDRIFNLGEEQSHHLAIDSMRLTAALLCSIVPGTCLVKTQCELESALRDGFTPVLSAADWLNQLEAETENGLAHTWEMTSDSIALWLAAALEIKRLILLKSTDLPPQFDLKTASRHGFLDGGFPELFQKIAEKTQQTVPYWYNLRGKNSSLVKML